MEHSLSPAMHNAAFKKLGLDFIYLPFRVSPENLEKAILGMRGLGIRGLSVTMPHKISVIKFLDKIDEAAKSIGAVNTIVNRNGKLVGFNTDGFGALRAFQEAGINLKNQKVLMLGAGGAAKSIAFYITPFIKELVIIDKDKNTIDNLRKKLKNTQILINATPVGMPPNINQSPIDTNLLRSDLIVFDVIYNPSETKLLREARNIGAKTINGISMLVHQGAEAFKLWTGKNAPIELMKKVVLKGLEN